MKVSEGIKKFGLFSLPIISDQPVSGILSISESGDTSLEIMGIGWLKQHLQFNNAEVKRITGCLENGQIVTLENCSWGQIVRNHPGFSKATIMVGMALIGHKYKNEDIIEFYKISFSVEGLFEWLSISGIDVQDALDNDGTNIQFSPPTDIQYLLNNGIKLKFSFGWNQSSSWKEVHITQSAYISIENEVPMSMQDWANIIFKLNNLFCLAIDNVVAIKDVSGYSQEILKNAGRNRIIEAPIQIYYETVYSDKSKEPNTNNFLFKYSDVKLQLQDIFSLWLENYSISEPAFNLYFSSKSGGSKYLDGKFLLLAQGIETLHRRNSSETLFAKTEFKELLNTIVGYCPEDKKEWLRRRISFGNELSLRERIEKMIEPFEKLYGSELQRRTLIKKIIDTRNYLTHYSPELEKKAARSEELWDLCMKLEALFQLNFLKLVGIELDQIKKISSCCDSLSDKLEYRDVSEVSD